MSVFNPDNLPPLKNAVLTIGTFDGVHAGHLQILRQLIKEADEVNGTAAVITFYPHPKQVITSSKKPLYILNTPEEKYALLGAAGIQNIIVVPFTTAFAEQPATNYIRDFLVKQFHPHTIIIGYDHRFGKGREGDYHLLEQEAPLYGFKVKEIPEHVLQNVTISSTRIREALLSGDIDTANEFLGYKYFFNGKIIEGNKLGRTIGYPTANILVDDVQKLIPADGVYAVEVSIEKDRRSYQGMMNIGMRPTIDGKSRSIEVNIFNFNAEVYGANIKVSLRKRLRDEVKFNSLDELKEQLQKDRQSALKVFSKDI